MSIIRPHKKSRDGCEGCKRRKIKCDEVHPSCSFCSSRRVKCVYPVRTAKTAKSSNGGSPSATVSSPPETLVSWQAQNPSPIATQLTPNFGLRMGELKLMHHYSVILSQQLALKGLDLQDTTKVWQSEIPRMAFEQDFLMHAVLCISSHHMQTQLRLNGRDTTAQSRQTYAYLDIALSGYRNAIMNLTPNNIEAVIAAALILVVLATRHHVMYVEGELWVVSFLGLHAGMQSVQSYLGKEKLSQSSLYPLLSFDDKLAEDPVHIPSNLESMLRAPESVNLPADQLQTLYETLQALGRLYGLLEYAHSPETRGVFFIKVMASGKTFPASFVTLIRQRLPQALVLMMHYLSFLKIPALHGFVAETIHGDMNITLGILAPRWMHFCETPRLIYSMTDPREVTMQLMLQLPQGMITLINNPPAPMSLASSSPGHMGGRIEELSDSHESPDRDVSMGPGMRPSGMATPVGPGAASPVFQPDYKQSNPLGSPGRSFERGQMASPVSSF